MSADQVQPLEPKSKNGSDAQISDSGSSAYSQAESQAADNFRNELDGITKTDNSNNIGQESDSNKLEGNILEGTQASESLRTDSSLDNPNSLDILRQKSPSELSPEQTKKLGLASASDLFSPQDLATLSSTEKNALDPQKSKTYSDRDVELNLEGTKVKFDDQDFSINKVNTVADVSVEHGENSITENVKGLGQRSTIQGQYGESQIIEAEDGSVHVKSAEGDYVSMYPGDNLSISNRQGKVVEGAEAQKAFESHSKKFDNASENQTATADDGFDWMDAGDWYDAGKSALTLGAQEAGEFLSDPVGTATDWFNEGYEWLSGDLDEMDPGDFNADLKTSKEARENSIDVEKSLLMNTKETDITYDQNYMDSLNWFGDSNSEFNWYNDFDSVKADGQNVAEVNTDYGKGLVNSHNGDVAIKTSDNNVHIYRADGSIVTNTGDSQIIRAQDGTVSYRDGDSNKGFITKNADGSTHMEASSSEQTIKADISSDGRRVKTEVNGDKITYDRDQMSASAEEADIAFDIGTSAGIESLRQRARLAKGTTRVDNAGNVAHSDDRGDITSDADGNVTVGRGQGALHAENETREEAEERNREEERRGEIPRKGRRQRFRNEDGQRIRSDQLERLNAEQLKSFNLERLEDGSYKHTKTGRSFSINDDGRAVWEVRNSDGSTSQLELGGVDQDGNSTHRKTKDGETASITHNQNEKTKIELASGQKLDFNEQTNKVELQDKDGNPETKFDLESGELDSDALKTDADDPSNSTSFFGGGTVYVTDSGWGSSNYNGFSDYEQIARESEAESKESTARSTVHGLIAAMNAARNSGNTGAILSAGKAITAAYGLVSQAVSANMDAGDTSGAMAASLLYSSINSANMTHKDVSKNMGDQNFYGGPTEGDTDMAKAITNKYGSIANPLIQRAEVGMKKGRIDDPIVQKYFNLQETKVG